MDFKIGDKVKIKDDISFDKLCGGIGTVSRIISENENANEFFVRNIMKAGFDKEMVFLQLEGSKNSTSFWMTDQMVSPIISRLSKDDYYIGIAKAVSARSTCLRRHYGAVIVKDDEIVSTGYNGRPRGESNCCDLGYCTREKEGHEHNDGDYSSCGAVHSEMNAIISASRKEMLGATLYLYGEQDGKQIKAVPCPICEALIKNAGIARVVGSEGEQL